MKKYEIMYILTANLDEEARKAEIAKLHGILTSHGAKINNVNEWGLRELAYEIKKQNKGYYVVIKVEADVNATAEFDRLTRINSNVLRYLIINDQD